MIPFWLGAITVRAFPEGRPTRNPVRYTQCMPSTTKGESQQHPVTERGRPLPREIVGRCGSQLRGAGPLSTHRGHSRPCFPITRPYKVVDVFTRRTLPVFLQRCDPFCPPARSLRTPCAVAERAAFRFARNGLSDDGGAYGASPGNGCRSRWPCVGSPEPSRGRARPRKGADREI
jgi:hypothetical protein